MSKIGPNLIRLVSKHPLLILLLFGSLFLGRDIVVAIGAGTSVEKASSEHRRADSGDETVLHSVQPLIPSTVFSNPASITIPDDGVTGVTSNISVSGMPGPISSLTLTLNNLTTPRPQHMDMLLVGPGGQKFVFLSDAGGQNAASASSNVTMTFSDASAVVIPQGAPTAQFTSGTFRPVDYDFSVNFPTSPAPYQHAPPFGAASFGSVFGGLSGASVNGTWTLHIFDPQSGPFTTQNVAGGWSLDITTTPAAAATTTVLTSSVTPSFTNQAITLTATVSSTSTVNTGVVNFVDNTTSTTLCSNVAVNGSGVATCNVPANTLTERIHQITATYVGNVTFATSNSTISQEVNNPTQISGTMFTNPGTIIVSDTSGVLSVPYPSNIFVSGLNGTISKVTVTLLGVNFPETGDLDLLLVGPGGQRYVFWSDVGGGASPSTGTFIVDDTAATQLPASGSIAAGTYRPTDYVVESDVFPAPAPAGPYSTAAPTGGSTFASVFGGAAPNGKWSLYATDDAGSGGITSSIAGWRLTFTTSGDAPTTTVLTSSPNPSTTTQPILFTATVTSTSTVTSGTVTFRRGAINLCNAVPVNGSGVATCNVTAGTIPQGTHVITADYNGSAGQFNISSGTTTQQVDSPTVVTCLNFANNGGITVSNATTLGNPYPSNINVSGLGGTISKVTLTITIGSALTPDHNDFLLVGPGGQKFLFMGDAGGNFDIINQTITVDDAAATALPDNALITSGTYRPASYTGDPDVFPAPAPAAPYNPAAPEGAGTLAMFNGISPNGTWKLFAVEDAGDAADTVINNWSLTFTIAPTPTTTTVSSSINPSATGQSVTFTATVATGGFGTPTGNVQFFDGASPIGSPVALNASGVAQLTTDTLTAGGHTITAEYAGATVTCGGTFSSSSGMVVQQVVAPPTISKAFGATNIALAGTTSLTFTVGNPNASTSLTNIAFNDSLPAGLVVASPNGLVNNCGGGTVTAVAGSNSISVSNLSRNAATTCTIAVNVTGTTEGAKNNVTGAISSTQGGTGLTASATVNVIASPTFTKAFGASTISQGGTTSLAFTIMNTSGTFPLSGVSFTDALPAGLVVATPNNQTGTCGGGTITAAAGSGSISLSGAMLAAGATCTFSADVTATSSGMKNNTVDLTTTQFGTPSATATASVNVPACTSNPVVNTTADTGAGSLRDALANVCTAPNNNISFSLTYPATIQLTSAELNIGKDANITGPGANQLEIKGSQTGAGIRVFNIPSGITANITGLTVTGGGTALGGAGVSNFGTLGLSACSVKGNQTTGVGGAGISNAGVLTIDSCTISNNVATVGNGGGILNSGTASLSVNNSTISTNTANAGSGGGISNSSTDPAAISRSTIAFNNADVAGTAGIANSGAPINITNTIVGNNTITGGGLSDLAGTFDSGGYNLFETVGTAVIAGDISGNIVADPRLGALLNYGGTTETHSLLIDSPALDAGDNTGASSFDQRGTGFSRVRDSADAGIVRTADIGAFEADPTIEDVTNKSTNEDVPLAVTFRVGDDVTGATPFNAFTATSDNTTLVPVANIVFSGGSGASGSGISNTGQRTVTITPAANLSGTATITIVASKTIGGTLVSMSDSFVVTVNSVPDTPSVTSGSTLEDTQTPSGQLVITANPSDGSSVTHFKITDIVNGSVFQSNGTTPIPADSFITIAQGAAGLRFTPSLNFFGNGAFNVTASMSASDAGLGGAPAAAAITVTPVNDAPTLIDPADVTINEDSGLQTVNLSGITAGPANETGQTVTVSASSNNIALIPNPVVNYTSPNATGSLTFTPVANQSGTANVTVTVMDSGGTANGGVNTFSQVFIVSVNPINDAPTLNTLPDPTILEDAQQQTINLGGITAGPNETQTLTVTANSNNQGLIPNPTVTYTSPNSTGSISFTPVANQNGSALITVTVTDDGGTANGGINTLSRTFMVNVTPVNDAPTLNAIPNFTILEDAALQTVNLSAITPGPANEAGQTLTVSANSNNTGLIPNPTVTYTSPDSTGSISFAPVADQFGSAVVTVTVTDDGGTANSGVNTFSRMFTVNVTAVNDAPTTTTIPDITVIQNGPNTIINLRSFFADVEDGSAGLVYTIQSNDNPSLFTATAIDNATDVLTLDYSPTGFGVANITIRATDSGSLFIDDTFKVTVVAPPTVTKAFSPISIAPGGASTVTITFGNANGIGLPISGTFTDTLPTNVTTTAAATATTCTGGTPGKTASTITLVGGTIPANAICTLTATVTSTTPGVHTNTIAAGDVVTTNGGSNTVGASATLTVATPPTVAKAFTPTLIVPGDSSAVKISLGNTNAFALTNAALTDNLPAGVSTIASTAATTCGGTVSQSVSSVSLSNGTIPSNGTCTVTVNVTSSIAGSYANSIATGDLMTSGGPNTAPATATLAVRAADYGDAPDSYATTRAANGARHGVVSGFSLGATVDTEADGVPSADASSDGADEDGVILPATPLVQGANASATVTLTNTALLANPRLDAWIDFNLDGDFDANERIANSIVLSAGANTVNFTTPAGAPTGSTFARFRLSDGGGLSPIGPAATGEVEDYTVVINQPPVAGNVNVFGTEDQASRVAILLTATDTVGDAVTQFRIDTVPTGGQLFDSSTGGSLLGAGSSVNAGGTGPFTATVYYQLNLNFNGAASFTYSAFDGSSFSAPATVAISIAAVNDPPTFALGANQVSDEDAGPRMVASFASSISPGPADEVISGQTVTTFTVTNNNNSLFSAQPAIAANGTLTYTSAPNAFGTATVTVSATDNGTPPATSSPQTFTITIDAVNDPPSFTKGADQTVNEDAGGQTVAGWATNISQGPMETGQTLTFNVTGNTNAGLFSVPPAVNPANGNLTYTPAPNANGTATITLTLSDNGSNTAPNSNTSAPQTFVINVTAVNDPPSFALGPNQTVNEDAGLQMVAAFATAISPGPPDESAQTVAFNLTNNNNSLFSTQPAISPTGTLTYTPAPNANGSATVSVTATDSAGATSAPAQTFSILVNAVNDAPVAVDDSYSTNEDTPLTVSAAGVLSNDTDVDNTNAQLSVATPRPVSGPSNGALTLNANGSFTYTPNANYFGNDSFTYRASDGAATSNIATVNIAVSAVNDAPVANNDAYSTNEDTQLVIASAASGVLANDTDVDHLNLQLTVAVPRPVSGPSNGTLILNANGTFTYTPNANFNGTDSFTYRATDGIANSNLATVTITVNAVNDAPVANDDFYSGVEDTVLTVPARGVLANDTDIDNTNAQLSVAAPRPVSGPSNGTLVLNADGSFTYTPNADFFGTDSFTYRTSDGASLSNIATVNLVISNVPDTFTIAGNIQLSTGPSSSAPLAGATVAMSGSQTQTTMTDGAGNYSFTVHEGGSYNVTPSGLGKIYEPITRRYSNVAANITNAHFLAFDQGALQRTLKLQNAYAVPGSPAAVSIDLTGPRGNERHFTFSLTYDTMRLSSPVVTCGPDAPGCGISTSLGAAGEIGINFSSPAVMPPGDLRLVTVTFQTDSGGAANTPIAFSDAPILRRTLDASNNPLFTGYTGGFVIFTEQGIEGDLAPRASGDGLYRANDVELERNFVAGLAGPSVTNEFERADVAPYASKGDGRLDASDFQLVINYVAGLVNPQSAGGPDLPTQASTGSTDDETEQRSLAPDASREFRGVSASGGATTFVSYAVDLTSTGEETVTTFSLQFDPAKLSINSTSGTNNNPDVTLGSGANAGTSRTVNATQVADGRIGVLLDFQGPLQAGVRRIVVFRFRILPTAQPGFTPIAFVGTPIAISTTNGNADPLTAQYVPGGITVLPFTAAGVTVGGRVTTPDGQGLRNVRVTIIDATGNRRVVTSSSFGYYRFEDVEAGGSYVISVSSRRYRFAPRMVQVVDAIGDLDFVGLE